LGHRATLFKGYLRSLWVAIPFGALKHLTLKLKACGVYKSLIKIQDEKIKALQAKKSKQLIKYTDHLFFPEYPNRSTMIAVAGRIFSAVVKRAGLQPEGEKHTLYSLRHTSIMYRLLLGNTSTLELARNSRTSQATIDKHYASRITPMMAVESIHSFK
jgi:hypothetical protein